MSNIAKYSTPDTVLTEGEANFIQTFLANNDCGAKTPGDLIDDNFSCQCVEDLVEVMGMTPYEVGGYLSSLEKKGVIWVEDERGATLPDLWWASDAYIADLDPELSFY